MPRPPSPKNGGHKYQPEGTSDCEYGCGCWMGGFGSGGPDGIDPFGKCPKNPGPKAFREELVQEIEWLEGKLARKRKKLAEIDALP
jgi:hypothetical protein